MTKPRILLVEDEVILRDHLARALSDEYVVDTAGNGREALSAVIRAAPVLIVTDIVMPDIDGIEFLKAVRSTRKTETIPVLLISGRAIDEQRIEGFKEGADAYLAKPYTERELRACIGSMLQSARKREESARREALEDAEKKALAERAALLESITDAFYALDGEFRFTYLNQRALDHFGKPREDLLGRVAWDVFPASRGTIFQHEQERALRAQCAIAFEAISPLSGKWLELRAFPTPQGLAAYFRDITDRKAAEEQLREADRRKSEFLAVLAHELRNPLAPLRNGLHILKLHPGTDPTLRQTVGMMDRQMTHLVRLVDDLLDVSRITLGKLTLRRQRVLLTNVLNVAVESSRSLIDANQHDLHIDLEGDDLVVEGDPDRLAQVFANLLSNSAKYTPRGGHITLRLYGNAAEAVIDVQDDGIGIPETALDAVFEIFTQVHPAAVTTTDGLGIGLSLVRTLVHMHGGSVQAFSDGQDRGSRFVVRLPRSLRSVAAVPSPAAASAGSRSRRVLVVDDNADAAAALATLLQMETHTVQTAADGLEAIERAREFEPEIVFMDLAMPRLGGEEATRRIRALPGGQDLHIIALTGWGQDADRERTREAGVDHHLVKPVDLDALRALMESLGAR